MNQHPAGSKLEPHLLLPHSHPEPIPFDDLMDAIDRIADLRRLHLLFHSRWQQDHAHPWLDQDPAVVYPLLVPEDGR